LQRLVHARKINPESCPGARLALNRDVPTALFHDAVHRRQSESSAFTHRLGGKKRFEDLRQRVRVHAGASVADNKTGIGSQLDFDIPACLGVFFMYVRCVPYPPSPPTLSLTRTAPP